MANAKNQNKTENKTEQAQSGSAKQQAETAPAGAASPGTQTQTESQKAHAAMSKTAQRAVLRVRALGEQFRRAGISFSRHEKVLPVEALTKDQVKALKAEPRLSVVEDQDEVEA